MMIHEVQMWKQMRLLPADMRKMLYHQSIAAHNRRVMRVNESMELRARAMRRFRLDKLAARTPEEMI